MEWKSRFLPVSIFAVGTFLFIVFFENLLRRNELPGLFRAFQDLWENGREYYVHLAKNSVTPSITGLLLASTIALFVCILEDLVPQASLTCRLYMTAIKATPAVALVPVLMMVTDNTMFSIRALTACALCLFPLYLNISAAVRSAPSGLVRFSEQLGTSRIKILLHIKIRFFILGILIGLQEAIPLALIGTLVAEILGGGSPSGLGHQLIKGPSEDWVGVFAVVLLCCALSISAVIASYGIAQLWTHRMRLNE